MTPEYLVKWEKNAKNARVKVEELGWKQDFFGNTLILFSNDLMFYKTLKIKF